MPNISHFIIIAAFGFDDYGCDDRRYDRVNDYGYYEYCEQAFHPRSPLFPKSMGIVVNKWSCANWE